MNNCKKNIETRAFTTAKLEKIGFEVIDSKANFIFAKNDAISGEQLYKLLKSKGILVRHFSDEKIKDYVRITIGARGDMETFLKTVKEILEEIK